MARKTARTIAGSLMRRAPLTPFGVGKPVPYRVYTRDVRTDELTDRGVVRLSPQTTDLAVEMALARLGVRLPDGGSVHWTHGGAAVFDKSWKTVVSLQEE